MSARYWILLTSPHATETVHGEGLEFPCEVIVSDGAMNKGDIVYLWSLSEQSLYGWGEITDVRRVNTLDELGDLLRVTVRRQVLRERLLTLPQFQENPDLVALVPDNPVNHVAIGLAPKQALALNALIRSAGVSAPVDPLVSAGTGGRAKVDRSLIADKPPISFDPRLADAAYRPFPAFQQWAACQVDEERWRRYLDLLTERGKYSSELLARSIEVVKRAAAIDTGAIEGLYEVDRGFTFTVASQVGLWEAMVDQKGPEFRSLFASHLKSYDYVLTLATQAEPLSEAAIRALHEQICEAQETYWAWTEIGWQKLKLPKGEYKLLPNHVIERDGEVHAYAPVGETPMEVHRFCTEMRQDLFLQAHPVLQASYAHYAFVVIHPFADGNGRVARALASVFTYRSHSVPLLILADNRDEYLSALKAADEGDYQRFVDFIFDRAVDAIRLVDEGLRAATRPSIDDAAANLKQIYTTKGGYTHQQVDQAGHQLLNLFTDELTRRLEEAPIKEMVAFTGTRTVAKHQPASETHRLPVIHQETARLVLNLNSMRPAEAGLFYHYGLEVPKDCGREDDLVIRNLTTGETFTARVSEMVPVPTAALRMRLIIGVQRILAEALDELTKKAAASLQNKGY